jgi:hypothetical protein
MEPSASPRVLGLQTSVQPNSAKVVHKLLAVHPLFVIQIALRVCRGQEPMLRLLNSAIQGALQEVARICNVQQTALTLPLPA